jgi:uncharacterized protein (TIGR02145 family)
VLPKCGIALYDPATRVCKDNILLEKCGEAFYNPATHGCRNNIVLEICGTISYDSKTQSCCNNRVYNLSTHGCKDNSVLPKCGETLYDPAIHVCKNNFVLAICGTSFYDPITHGCRDNIVLEKANVKGENLYYGGQTYKIILIGAQMWMAENLNYNVSGSKCYDNDSKNCDKYGRLYNWNAAKRACPGGWHLPSNVEWDELMTTFGSFERAGKRLKVKSGWAALLGGGGFLDSSFDEVGNEGYWWSATELDASDAYGCSMHNENDVVDLENYNKNHLFSVRCVMD